MIEIAAGALTLLFLMMIYMALNRSNRDVFEKIDAWSKIEQQKKEGRGRSTLTYMPIPLRINLFLGRYMIQAGLPLRGDEAILLWIVIVLLCLLTGIFSNLYGAIVMVFLGLFVPPIWIKGKIAGRKRRIESQLPGLLDLLASGLRAGFSFRQSLQNASERIAEPIGSSLRYTIGELSLGVDMEVALRRWVDRTGSVDLDLAVTSALIQREIGGNLATILDNTSNLMRDRQEAEAQMRALTSQGRLEGLIISIMPVALAGILVFINPEYMEPLFRTVIGRKMLAMSFFMALLGIFLIQRIVKPKY